LQRQYKTVVVLVCIILSVLLLSLSIESLGEVPTLEDLQTPRLPRSKPETSPTPNPESTRLEKPSVEMAEADPLFRVRGSTGTSYGSGTPRRLTPLLIQGASSILTSMSRLPLSASALR